jgi:hypothetical protein
MQDLNKPQTRAVKQNKIAKNYKTTTWDESYRQVLAELEKV